MDGTASVHHQQDILPRQAMMNLLTMGWSLAHTSLATTPEHSATSGEISCLLSSDDTWSEASGHPLVACNCQDSYQAVPKPAQSDFPSCLTPAGQTTAMFPDVATAGREAFTGLSNVL